ncbi:hypothetical protein MCOR25_005215 [Pyricularia grisea]|nr:hypothetical protein MCOR25_005215 [Pyricularia grisea]
MNATVPAPSILHTAPSPPLTRYSVSELLSLGALDRRLDDAVNALLAGLRQDIFASQSPVTGTNVVPRAANENNLVVAHHRAIILDQIGMLPRDWSERWPNPNGFTSITHRVERPVSRRWAVDGTVLRLREGEYQVVLSDQERERSSGDAPPYNATMLMSVLRTGTRNIVHLLGGRLLDVDVDEMVFLVTVGVSAVLGWRSDANLRRFVDSHIDSLIWRPRFLETRSATDTDGQAEWVPVDDGNDDSDEGRVTTPPGAPSRRSRSTSMPVNARISMLHRRYRRGSWTITERVRQQRTRAGLHAVADWMGTRSGLPYTLLLAAVRQMLNETNWAQPAPRP